MRNKDTERSPIIFIKNISLIECPVCHNQMHIFQEKSLVCERKHCFDIAKQGYVNFSQSKNATYPAELFVHRQKIFADGFYKPLVKLIDDLIIEWCGCLNPVILDAGCGEGYYSKSVLSNFLCTKLAFDISKEAIQLAAKNRQLAAKNRQLAAKSRNDVVWMVAGLDNIPVRSNSADVILDILTPANYSEFNRVLKRCGIIIKVIPCANYLIELRKLAINRLANKEYDNTEVAEHFKSQTQLVKQLRLSYKLPVNTDQAVSFAKMTPMMTYVALDELHLNGLSDITIELDVFIGKTKTVH